MFFTFNDDSLKRHKISHEDVLEALEDPFKLEVKTGEYRGNPTSLWIGRTFTERLLEIGIEYLEDCNHIYHAKKANAEHAAKYLNKRF